MRSTSDFVESNFRTVGILLVATLITFTTCSVPKRVPMSAPVMHHGVGWVATEQKSGTFLIIAHGNQAATDAVKELCSKEYICFGPDTIGEALLVERRKK